MFSCWIPSKEGARDSVGCRIECRRMPRYPSGVNHTPYYPFKPDGAASWRAGRRILAQVDLLSCSAAVIPCGTMGSDRRRAPVAWKRAPATAGATATIGVSPAPTDGRSFRSSRTTSIVGRSLKRGTRYSENRGLRIFPSSNWIAS